MKATIRVPLEQYAFVEFEGEMTEEEAFIVYKKANMLFKGEPEKPKYKPLPLPLQGRTAIERDKERVKREFLPASE